jgi:hypothetical protein
MLKFLYPKKYLMSVYELTPEMLKSLGIKTVIFDIDNTLVPYWIKEPDEKLCAYFTSLRDNGITISVLSNSKEQRSKVFCRSMNIPYVYRAGKPLTGGLNRLIEKLGVDRDGCLIAGDQIFTDVWCGNMGGIYSVLIKQVSPKDEWITKPKRGIERLVVKSYLKSLKENNNADK